MSSVVSFIIALAILAAAFFGTAVLAGLWVRTMLEVVAL
jgi:hypothetical protein